MTMNDADERDPLSRAVPEVETPGGAGDDLDVEIVSFGDDDEDAGASPEGPRESGVERELAELRERHLRLRADFENFRKRAERERDERLRRGVAESMRELLPVADNLERALAAEGSKDDLRRGVEMIARQLEEVLRQQGVTAIASVGLPFDPQIHEAVAREESPGVETPTVVAEFQRGYLHGDRLLRPAMVRVAMPVSTEAATRAGAAEDGEGES